MIKMRQKGKIMFFILVLFIKHNINAQSNIEYLPETGDYKISYYQDNGQYFETIFEPATKIDPNVQIIIDFNENINSYVYYYKVNNLIASKQRLRVFSIEYYSSLSDVSSPNDSWSIRYFKNLPILDWANSKGVSGLRSPKDGIAPDSSQSGFQFKSHGLPTIVKCYFMGGVQGIFSLTEDVPSEVNEFLKIHEEFPANTVQSKTLGPADPPDPFIPSVFVDTLSAYTSESKLLGWIQNAQTEEKYLNYFSTVKVEINDNRISEAKMNLSQVLTDVAADSGVVLTSEAYALLRYNTEYLFSQLQESGISIEDLIVYIRQAEENGTVDNAGIANSLIKKLENAQKQLEKEKTKQAINLLNAFLNELEAQHGKHITDEVYTYLKEKVEGLIGQLEE